jgi:hypothetical protein
MRLAALAVVLQMSHAFSSGTTLNAKAWGFDPSSWPEMTANLAGFSTERPNSGMANAGNGWAAYMITQGALRGLSTLDLVKHTRCIPL